MHRTGQMQWSMKTLISLILLVIGLLFTGLVFLFLGDVVGQSGDNTLNEVEGNLLAFRDEVEQHCGLEAKIDEDAIKFTFHPAIRKVYAWPRLGSGNRERGGQGQRLVADVEQHSRNASVPLKLCNDVAICKRGDQGEDCGMGGEIHPPQKKRAFADAFQVRLTLYYGATTNSSDFLLIDETGR